MLKVPKFMRPRTSAKSASNSRIISSKQVAPGFNVVHKETVINRVRSKADQSKVDALIGFITVAIGNEDLDSTFLTVFNHAQELGYRLTGSPEDILRKLNDLQ